MPPNGLDTAGTYFARASHWSSCAALRLSIGEKPRLNTGLFVTVPSETRSSKMATIFLGVFNRPCVFQVHVVVIPVQKHLMNPETSRILEVPGSI